MIQNQMGINNPFGMTQGTNTADSVKWPQPAPLVHGPCPTCGKCQCCTSGFPLQGIY